MIIETTAREFDKMSLSGKKKVLGDAIGCKVNSIVSGSLVNGCFGEYYVRHHDYSYSRIRVNINPDGSARLDRDDGMFLLFRDFSNNEWVENFES